MFFCKLPLPKFVIFISFLSQAISQVKIFKIYIDLLNGSTYDLLLAPWNSRPQSCKVASLVLGFVSMILDKLALLRARTCHAHAILQFQSTDHTFIIDTFAEENQTIPRAWPTRYAVCNKMAIALWYINLNMSRALWLAPAGGLVEANARATRNNTKLFLLWENNDAT